jgi:hypothetical protein
MIDIPEGKTVATIIRVPRESILDEPLKIDDFGYIDGYVQMATNSGYAVFIRQNDGAVELLDMGCFRAGYP